ncbi:MAG: hypothetical protein R3A45_08305 [Bdellovibrionota bacterium]
MMSKVVCHFLGFWFRVLCFIYPVLSWAQLPYQVSIDKDWNATKIEILHEELNNIMLENTPSPIRPSFLYPSTNQSIVVFNIHTETQFFPSSLDVPLAKSQADEIATLLEQAAKHKITYITLNSSSYRKPSDHTFIGILDSNFQDDSSDQYVMKSQGGRHIFALQNPALVFVSGSYLNGCYGRGTTDIQNNAAASNNYVIPAYLLGTYHWADLYFPKYELTMDMSLKNKDFTFAQLYQYCAEKQSSSCVSDLIYRVREVLGCSSIFVDGAYYPQYDGDVYDPNLPPLKKSDTCHIMTSHQAMLEHIDEILQAHFEIYPHKD